MKKRFGSILITGASSGIGAALARHYAAPGVRLCLNGRDGVRLAAVAEVCRAAGASVETHAGSVTDREGLAGWISGCDEAFPLDLVIANAGISGGNGGDPAGEGIAKVREIFDVNVTGVFNTLEPVLASMLARKSGQLAIVSSLAGFRGFPSAPGYSASKAAVKAYGEGLRGALHDSGVGVSVICPGFVKSGITDRNDFPMPFLMSGEQAARIIAAGLAADRGRIAFPAPTYAMTYLMSILPDVAAQSFLRVLPKKR